MFPSSRTRRFAPALVFGVLAAVCGALLPHARAWADDEPLAPALKALQGMWIVERDGSIQTVWTIKDDTITARVDGVEYVGKLTADDQAEPHPSLTVEIQKGPPDAQGETVKAIYKLEGETLAVHVANPGVDRPADFKAAEGQTRLYELTKVKGSK